MAKQIKNNDSVEHTWVGQTIAAGDYHLIDATLETTWANNATLLAAILNGIAIVNNGTTDITDPNSGIDFLKGSILTVQVTGASSKISDPILKGILGASGVTFNSHDFSDRSTWYQNSLRITDETLTDSGDGLTFTSAHPYWVDIYGKRLIFLRNRINKRDGTLTTHSAYAVIVKIDSVLQTSGYTVDFTTGAVTFGSSQSGKVVTCSYSHNDGVTNRSEWVLAPPAGKTYYLDHVEIQFSKTITFSNTVRFEVWAGNTITYFTSANWSDAIFDGGYGQMRADYQDVRGIINQCNLGTGAIPACTNAGTTADVLVFPFDYVKAIALNGDQKTLVRICILGDAPLTTSDICSVSFYTQIGNN